MGSEAGGTGPFRRVLGVLCTTSAAFFALLIDGKLNDEEPRRIEPPEVLGGGERLRDFRDRMRREIARTAPELVVIATSSYQASYEQIASRATLETLIRLAAAEERVPSEFLNQKTIRARLGIPPKGKFGPLAEGYFRERIEEPPLYWTEGRAAAAAAALVRSRH